MTEEQNSHDLTKEQLNNTEKKTAAYKSEIEEAKSYLDKVYILIIIVI